MEVRARDSVGACDLKTARKGALFWSPMDAGSSDELEVVLVAGALWGCKTTSFGAGGLA